MAKITGEVAFRRNAGEWQSLKPGQILSTDEEVFTGVESGLTLQFSDGSTMQVEELTQLLIDTVSRRANRKDVAVRLKVGQISSQVQKEKVVDTNFETTMPTATAPVRGTKFTAYADAKATVVTTQEGLVLVDPKGAGLESVLVPAGKEVAVTPRSISRLTAPGKSDARGGVGRRRARDLALTRLGRAPARCRLTTPRSANVVTVTTAAKGWAVSVTIGGKVRGKSKWRVARTRFTPVNAVAKRVARGCR